MHHYPKSPFNEILFKKIEDHFGTIESIPAHLMPFIQSINADYSLYTTDNFKSMGINESRLRSILDKIENGYFEIDLKGNFLFINKSLCSILGYSKEQVFSKISEEAKDNKNLNIVRETFADLVKNVHTESTFGWKLTSKNNSYIYTEVSIFLLLDNSMKKWGYCGIVNDVTERKKIEENLMQNEARYRLLADNMVDIMWTMDMDLNYTFNSPSVERIIGYTPEEVAEIGVENILTPESMKKAYNYYINELQTLNEGRDEDPFRIRTLELVQRHKKGHLIVTDVNMTFIRDRNDKPIGILGTTRDITEKKIAQESLKQSEERLRKRNLEMEKDLEAAQLIQNSLVTQDVPTVKDIKIDYRYYPMDAVGGDYFSFTSLPHGGVGFFLGDVASHGVTAALFLALVRATTDRICKECPYDTKKYLKSLNSELIDNMPRSFLTAIYGVFQKRNNGKLAFSFSSGGHPPILLFQASSGMVSFLETRGRLLGVFNEIKNSEQTMILEKGDRVFMYTDGIPEAKNKKGELLGFDKLLEIVGRHSKCPLNENLDSVIAEVEQFRDGLEQDDDIVFIGCEIN